MDSELKASVIELKSLEQDIPDPIIVGSSSADSRYLSVIFTQEAAAHFAPETKVYLKWYHIDKDIRGYNCFEKAQDKPLTYTLFFPKTMLKEGTVTACIELVDSYSIAASVNFEINVTFDPNDGSNFIASDDWSTFQQFLMDISSVKEEMQNLFDSYQSQFEAWENKINESQSNSEEALNNSQSSLESISNVLTQLSTMSATLNSLSELGESLQNSLSQVVSDISDIENQQQSLENRVTALENDKTSLVDDIEDLQKQVANHESNFTTLQDQMVLLNSNVSTLATSVETCTAMSARAINIADNALDIVNEVVSKIKRGESF